MQVQGEVQEEDEEKEKDLVQVQVQEEDEEKEEKEKGFLLAINHHLQGYRTPAHHFLGRYRRDPGAPRSRSGP